MYRYHFANFVSQCELTREEALLNSSEFMILHQEENAKIDSISIELYVHFVIVVVWN